MLEFRGEVTFEVVFDDEDAKEIGIAPGAEDVPGESGQAESGDGGGMKKAESVAPAFCEEGPEEYRAADENDASRAFGENGETEKKSEEE